MYIINKHMSDNILEMKEKISKLKNKKLKSLTF